MSALSLAAYLGHADIVSLLLAAGASAMLPDSTGSLPLHRAAARGKVGKAAWAGRLKFYIPCSGGCLRMTARTLKA